MTVDISKPEYESRIAILKTKLRFMNQTIPEDVLDFIASNVSESIRELEGVLNSVLCQMQLRNGGINMSDVKNLVKNNTKQQKNISAKDIIRVVSEFYNIEEKHMCEKTRKKEVVKPRQVAMYILREDLNSSYPYIGQKLGGRDHTTVIHACEKIKEDMKNSETLIREIEQIKNMLFGGDSRMPILSAM